MTACWFIHCEQGGFPVLRDAVGACDLSALYVGGERQWLVRREGRDIAEGAARSAADARRQAEAGALGMRLPVDACGDGGRSATLAVTRSV
jgi:hypothetical protein